MFNDLSNYTRVRPHSAFIYFDPLEHIIYTASRLPRYSNELLVSVSDFTIYTSHAHKSAMSPEQSEFPVCM